MPEQAKDPGDPSDTEPPYPPAAEPGEAAGGSGWTHGQPVEGAGLVPPLKVMRRRLNGVYQADGLAGPTRRYVLLVTLLVALASLPTLAVISAGTANIESDRNDAMDIPFLPPPSSGPVVRPDASSPPGQADPGALAPNPAGHPSPSTADPGSGRGHAQAPARRPASADRGRPESRPVAGYGSGRSRPAKQHRPSRPKRPPTYPSPPGRPPGTPVERPGGDCRKKCGCDRRPHPHGWPGDHKGWPHHWPNGRRWHWPHGKRSWQHGKRSWQHGKRSWQHGKRSWQHGKRSWQHGKRAWAHGRSGHRAHGHRAHGHRAHGHRAHGHRATGFGRHDAVAAIHPDRLTPKWRTEPSVTVRRSKNSEGLIVSDGHNQRGRASGERSHNSHRSRSIAHEGTHSANRGVRAHRWANWHRTDDDRSEHRRSRGPHRLEPGRHHRGNGRG